MKRREFITLLAGATAWPLAATAQQARMTARINLKTAKTIGVELPTEILLRADEVIE